MLMPYNGSVSFDNESYGITTIIDSGSQSRSTGARSYSEDQDLYSYIDSFHPFLYSGNISPSEGTSISVLKKDGSWDLVKFYRLLHGGNARQYV